VTVFLGQHAVRSATTANNARATLRIPLHYGHLALKAGAALVVVLVCSFVLVLKGLEKVSPEQPWQIASAGIALAAAIGAMLHAIWRLQDGDAGLIIAPAGLTIRSENPGRRMGRIAWSAIAGFKTRRHKGHAHIEVQLRSPALCIPAYGPFGRLLHAVRLQAGAGKVVITPFWLCVDPRELETLLAGYLARHGLTAR